MRVHEVMTRCVECIEPEDSVLEAATTMKQMDIGTLPVSDGGRVVGIVTDRDITIRAVAMGYDVRKLAIRDVMTRDVVHCFDDQLISDAAQAMQDNHVRRLVVLNRFDQLVGIVSLGDLAVQTGDDDLVGNTLERVCVTSS